MSTKQRPTEEAYAELQQAYDFYNVELFEGKLPACLITFQRQKKTMGYFHRNRFARRDGVMTDEIAMNPGYFAVVPMIEVLQTLVHEQVHQWQDHFGTPSRVCYHNTEWADKMEAIGLMPSDTGMPGGKRTGQKVADYMIPGGRFDIATRKLIAGGFAITWLDRYPEQPPAKYSPSYFDAEEAVAQHGAELSPDGPGANNPYMPPSMATPDLVEPVQTGNRSNRDKYTCPGCDTNVWGKPGLRLRCDGCDELFVSSAALESEHA